MPGETRNVFISHIHEDDVGLADLKQLLASKGMNIRDSSINSRKQNAAESPEYIKSQILAPNINWAGTFLVYITPQTKDSEWVNWEIEYAAKQGKTIVGVWELGCSGCEVPEALDLYGHAIVGWNGDRIIDAVNGEYEGFEAPDGVLCAPRAIRRHPC